jgi:hypothetical protein
MGADRGPVNPPPAPLLEVLGLQRRHGFLFWLSEDPEHWCYALPGGPAPLSAWEDN